MSRTWRKGEADYKHSQEYKNRRSNKRNKYNSHYEAFEKKLSREDSRSAYKTNWNYELDTDTD